MGVRGKNRGLLTALLLLSFPIFFHPRLTDAYAIGEGACMFREAGISVAHAHSVSKTVVPVPCIAGESIFPGRMFLDEDLLLGNIKEADRPLSSEENEVEIENNMREEEVAETPVDIYEEEEKEIPLPIDLNKRVEYAIKYFQIKGDSHFRKWFKRSGKYEKLIKRILRSEGVPGDMTCLAMIESGYSTNAVSRAGAVGIWQFMYWTGKKYGLSINWWDDERRDFEHSTKAAAKYLKDLYDMFGSWYLAAAAYNVGEGKLDRAIRRYRTKDYWKLVKYRYLPRETKNYVPKMLAALTIVKDPETYGFYNMEVDRPLKFDVVDLPGALDLRTLSEIIGVDYKEVKMLNPGIRRGISPPDLESYPVRLPIGNKEKVESNLPEIERRGKVKLILHRVRSKDNIYRIAKRYSADIMRIKEVNGLRSNRIRGRKRLIIPILGASDKPSLASLKPIETRSLRYITSSLERSARYYYVYKEGNRKIYLVKKGDSLYKISRRFGVPISTLKRLNGLRGNIIRPGQKLAIRVYGKSNAKKRNVYSYKVHGGKKIYTVKPGNTLYSISRAFSVTVSELRRMNGIKGEIIRPGMKLIVGYTG